LTNSAPPPNNDNRYQLGVRNTQQRTVILEELRKCRTHPGADELYAQVRRRLPRISLGTVYRNLELLAAQGCVQRLELGPGGMRFDPMVEEHAHFRCTECGRVEDLPFAARAPRPDRRHPWVRERRIDGARIEYFGRCPRCHRGNRRAASTAGSKSYAKGERG